MGQLRDAISNSLFPGASLLPLGARYMLLVPWACLTAHSCTRYPDDLRKRSEESERHLIGRLKELGEDSYIGRDAFPQTEDGGLRLSHEKARWRKGTHPDRLPRWPVATQPEQRDGVVRGRCRPSSTR